MFVVEYRINGEWLPYSGHSFKTKKLAKEFAESSSMCQRNGYQIKKRK